jgi:hypothetical protein
MITDRMNEPVARGPRPPKIRIAAVALAIVSLHVLLLWLTRPADASAPVSVLGLAATGAAGVVSAALMGSAGEWLVHRFIMHRRWRPRLLRAIDRVPVADIHPVGGHPGSAPAQLGRVTQSRLVDVAQGERGALVGETDRQRSADARRRARDCHDLGGDVFHGRRLQPEALIAS